MAQQPSSFGRQLVKWLVTLCVITMAILSYIDVVYLPEKKLMEEQQASIEALEHQVNHLINRGGDANAEATKRMNAMEAAMKRVSPEVYNVFQKAMKEAKEAEQEAAKPTPTPQPRPRQLRETPGSKPAKSGEQDFGTDDLKVVPTPRPAPNKKLFRDDSKCGKQNKVDGGPGQCDPDGTHPCCAPSGWCGNSEGHCNCQDCVDYSPANPAAASTEGDTKKYDENTPKAIALVVPMRDRGVHLERFRERIQSHAEAWNKKGVKHTWMVFVVEQFDNALFNRGYLFNVGFAMAEAHAKKTGRPFDCVVMHDIDIIPEPIVDYGWCIWPNQIAGEIECWGWSVPYPDNVGGVVSLSPAHWKRINGFSNEYEGWGGEDDDLYLRLKQHTLLKGGCHTFCKGSPRPSGPMVYRPPLGKGRFNCLHDGDHTPRQRSPDDGAMWQKLSAMKSNSKRWKQDGVTSISVNHANPVSVSEACEAGCAAPEDPMPRQRLFGEYWARISAKPLISTSRIRISLNACADESRPLQAIPAGLEDLRQLVGNLFNTSQCASKLGKNWNVRSNFVLVDVTIGQVHLVGNGAPVVVPDSSLPSVPLPTDQTKPPMKEGSEHMVQGQRLTRWIRKLPPDHTGIIIVLGKEQSLQSLAEDIEKAGRRWPMTVPACIATANMDGGKKFRITPGTQWCGDGGWDHSSFFHVLRSKTSVEEDDVLPVCISYSSKTYAYRFDNSESGCAGSDSKTGVTWKHAHTLHSSKTAKGDKMCVGFAGSGDRSRWSIEKGEKCELKGFVNKFSFHAMNPDYTNQLARGCIIVTNKDPTTLKASGGEAVRRVVVGKECDSILAAGNWRLETEIVLLAAASETSSRICAAEGVHADLDTPNNTESSGKTSSQSERVWRVFHDASCNKKRVATHEAGDQRPRTHWKIDMDNMMHLPKDGSGSRWCLCKVQPTQKAGSSGLPYFTWSEGDCGMTNSKSESCFNKLSDMDIVHRSYLLDEVG